MLNTQTYGQATDNANILIAHGLFGSARNWGVIAKRLADTRAVVAVDMRNHGTSPWFDTHSYADMADDLAQVLTQASDVVGHSMGGKAAMMLALTHPEKVQRLIVADIAPVTYEHTQMGPIEAMRGVDLSKVTSRSDVADQLNGLEPGVDAFLLQSLDLNGKRWRFNLDALARDMDKIIGFPDVDAVFEGPTLFLSGAESTYVQPAHRNRIKTLFPHAKFAKIPGAGHWLHAERPKAFEAAVRAFLARD